MRESVKVFNSAFSYSGDTENLNMIIRENSER